MAAFSTNKARDYISGIWKCRLNKIDWFNICIPVLSWCVPCTDHTHQPWANQATAVQNRLQQAPSHLAGRPSWLACITRFLLQSLLETRSRMPNIFTVFILLFGSWTLAERRTTFTTIDTLFHTFSYINAVISPTPHFPDGIPSWSQIKKLLISPHQFVWTVQGCIWILALYFPLPCTSFTAQS